MMWIIMLISEAAAVHVTDDLLVTLKWWLGQGLQVLPSQTVAEPQNM